MPASKCYLCHDVLDESKRGVEWSDASYFYPVHFKCEKKRIYRINNRLCVLCGKPYGDAKIIDGYHEGCYHNGDYQGYDT